MADSIQDKINQQAIDSKNEMLWGKPANDILNGRDMSASAKPIRAIWEMVQNARDVSANESNIVFTRRNGTFEFKHDGLPFVNDTLNALILQTSAKSRNDGDQVGQYGTGFLTTHKFGREFHLAGSLKLVDDKELYYNFPKLIVDRTPNTREAMATSLAKQFEAKDRWLEDLNYRSTTPDKWTVFTYQQPNLIEGKNVEEAYADAPEMIPYVLSLNEAIKSIKLKDEVVNRVISFASSEKRMVEETELSKVYKTAISVEDSNGELSDDFSIITLQSKKTVTTKKGIVKPMTTVVMPVRCGEVITLSDKVARLFIYLPLVGTEQWGVNFMFHAPLFTCSADDRSSLRLIMDGQTADDPATNNRQYISEATDMVFEYISLHLAEWQNVHLLAPVCFNVGNANKDLSDYYKSLKTDWIQRMKDLNMVKVNTDEGCKMVNPSSVFVLDAALAKAVVANSDLLMPLYRVLSNMHKDSVPAPDLLVYWSIVFDQWYEGEVCTQIKSIADIINYIDKEGLNAIIEDDLLEICKYLKDSEQLSFFDKNILPTEAGILTNKTQGYRCDAFSPVLKDCIRILMPEHANQFVKQGFAELISLPVFGNKEVKESLSACTEALQKSIAALNDAERCAWDNKVVRTESDGLLLNDQNVALLNYCRMVIPASSDAFQAKALDLLCEYYDIEFLFDDSLDFNFFDWRGALRTLVSNVLTEFTLLTDEEKQKRKDWILRMVTCVFGYSEFNGMLQNYRVYLSQSGKFFYCKELKKDAGIPEKMKEIYNILLSSGTTKIDVHDDLFDKDFGKVAITEASWEVVLFGGEIMNEIHASGKYLNEIDSYEHKDLIMDIMNNFDNEEDGKVWQNAFETIYNDIPSLLAKLVLNKDNREPMIKIMKVKDKERLNKAAEIISDENMFSIWNLGKQAWIEKQNEKHDFEKKKELGTYVEEYLRKELKEVLEGNQLKADVDDKQGGQDIIIYINEAPVYYIEVKSRWISADSVMMSASQLDRSVEKKDCYSLFAVDMVGFNGENVKEHIYPDTMEEFIDRIRVVTNIGELNDEILPTKRDPHEEVHIGGDYKAVVPQNLIERNHIDYNSFVRNVLIPKAIEALNYSSM